MDIVPEDDFSSETEAEREARKATEVVLDPLTQQFVNQLVDKLIQFTNHLSGHQLRPYQEPFARRIFESLIIGDTAVLTALYSRQSGKSETVANCAATAMIMLPRLARAYPELLDRFSEGVAVGAFAPVDYQADILFGRITARLTSERAQAIFADPDINEKIVNRGGGKTRRLRCGSFVTKNTAHPSASIEGGTFHLILVDECQGAEDGVINNSIMPMATATGGTKIFTGTPGYHKNVFYSSIMQNRRDGNKAGALRQNHYEADWKEVSKYSEWYRRTALKEMLRLGEDSDEFRRQYCVAPETRVLTADLRHIPAADVRPGMELLGFDEERPGRNRQRRFRRSVVQSAQRITRPCYRISLDDGTSITASAEHRWLISTAGGRTYWKATEDLTPSDRILRLTSTWETASGWHAGYLSAAYDGEGHLYQKNGRAQLGFAQRENVMLGKVQKALADLGFDYRAYTGADGCSRVHLGSKAEILRLLGQVRPERLLEKLDVDALGPVKTGMRHPRVLATEFAGNQEVIAMRTSTGTFIAEGLASHNCNQWLLEKGMFVTAQRLDELGDETMRIVRDYHRTPVIVGIDLGRKQDRTVVTVVFVDWDHPDALGYYTHVVLSWLDLERVDWEEQYYAIVDFLRHYNIYKVGVDTNGMGDIFIDRMRRMMPDVNFVDLGSSPKDQSPRWKHLRELLDRHLISWPAHEDARKTREWRRFRQEMEDLEIEHKGPYVLGKAPKVADAHDDYPDSLSMACILTTEEETQEVEQAANVFYNGRRRFRRA